MYRPPYCVTGSLINVYPPPYCVTDRQAHYVYPPPYCATDSSPYSVTDRPTRSPYCVTIRQACTYASAILCDSNFLLFRRAAAFVFSAWFLCCLACFLLSRSTFLCAISFLFRVAIRLILPRVFHCSRAGILLF